MAACCCNSYLLLTPGIHKCGNNNTNPSFDDEHIIKCENHLAVISEIS
jgi:hypothetical protein